MAITTGIISESKQTANEVQDRTERVKKGFIFDGECLENPSPAVFDASGKEAVLIRLTNLPVDSIEIRVCAVTTERNIIPQRASDECCVPFVNSSDHGFIHYRSPITLGGKVWALNKDTMNLLVPRVAKLAFVAVNKTSGELLNTNDMGGIEVRFEVVTTQGQHFPANYFAGV